MPSGRSIINPNSYAISPGYFSTIGQSFLEGRDFNAADDGRNHVAIVNRALAEREWPGESALGHRVHTGEIRVPEGESWATIVGVVANVHNYDLVSKPGPDLYIPRAENPSGFARFLLKANGDPAILKNAARSKLKNKFPEAKIFGFETMSEEMSSEVSERVFLMEVAISFGADRTVSLRYLERTACWPMRFRFAKRKSAYAWHLDRRERGSSRSCFTRRGAG